MTAQRVTTMAIIVVLASSVGLSQVKTTVPDVVPGARPATVEHITIHGKALEGNLEGDAAERTVLVFLPPSYARERNRMIVVLLDSKTVHNGSMDRCTRVRRRQATSRTSSPAMS
jgi:hypothetical protein